MRMRAPQPAVGHTGPTDELRVEANGEHVVMWAASPPLPPGGAMSTALGVTTKGFAAASAATAARCGLPVTCRLACRATHWTHKASEGACVGAAKTRPVGAEAVATASKCDSALCPALRGPFQSGAWAGRRLDARSIYSQSRDTSGGEGRRRRQQGGRLHLPATDISRA